MAASRDLSPGESWDLMQIAIRQRRLVWGLAALMVCSSFTFYLMVTSSVRIGFSPFALPVIVFLAANLYPMLRSLGRRMPFCIGVAVMLFIPLVGLVVLGVAIAEASNALRAAGLDVDWLGARKRHILLPRATASR